MRGTPFNGQAFSHTLGGLFGYIGGKPPQGKLATGSIPPAPQSRVATRSNTGGSPPDLQSLPLLEALRNSLREPLTDPTSPLCTWEPATATGAGDVRLSSYYCTGKGCGEAEKHQARGAHD